MNKVISLAKLDTLDRRAKMEVATADIVVGLKERYPESQGFVYKVQDRLASWAWPSGTKMSERELLRTLDPQTVKCAFRRGIRVTKGLRWGLTMDIQTTEREMTGLQLNVLRESPLSVIIGISGVLAGIVAAVGYGFQIGAFKDDFRNLIIAIFIGFAIGAGLALIGWFISRTLESLKPQEAQEIFDSTGERITRAMFGAS